MVMLGQQNNVFQNGIKLLDGNIIFTDSVSGPTIEAQKSGEDLTLKTNAGGFDFDAGSGTVASVSSAGVLTATGLSVTGGTSYSEMATSRTIGADTYKTVLTVGAAGETLISNYKAAVQQGYLKLAEDGSILLTALADVDITLTTSGTGNVNISANDLEMAGTIRITSAGGLIVQADTTANRPGSPVTGQMYWDTTLAKTIIYSGAAWVNMDGTAL